MKVIGSGVVATAAWTPVNLPGLDAWFKSSGITGYSDGDTVAIWINSGGNTNLAASGSFPTYKASAINGVPGLRFNGTDQFMTGAIADSDPQTLFVVGKFVSTTPVNGRLIAYSALRAIFTSSGASTVSWYCDSGFAPKNIGGTATTGAIYTVKIDGSANVAVDLNGTNVLASFSSIAASGQMVLGATESYGTANGNVDVCEVIRSTQVLSAGNVTKTVNYLKAKYGIA